MGQPPPPPPHGVALGANGNGMVEPLGNSGYGNYQMPPGPPPPAQPPAPPAKAGVGQPPPPPKRGANMPMAFTPTVPAQPPARMPQESPGLDDYAHMDLLNSLLE